MAHGTVRCGLVLLSLLTLVPCRHISRDKSEQADYPRRCDCVKVIVDCTTRNGNFPTNSPVRTRELDDTCRTYTESFVGCKINPRVVSGLRNIQNLSFVDLIPDSNFDSNAQPFEDVFLIIKLY